MLHLKETLRSMTHNARIPAAAGAVLISLSLLTGCQQLNARDQINKGVQAFKNAKYEEATQHFQEAIYLDPKLEAAKLYLATAYAYQVVPNDTEESNLKIANNAIAIFKEDLATAKTEKAKKNDLQQLASIYRNIKQPVQAKEYELQVIQNDPNDAEAHYTIGAVNFVESYNNAVKLLGENGMKDDGEGNVKMSKDTCAKIKALNTGLVTEAISHLEKAISLRTDYDDAMSYANLMYRRKADIDCGNPAAVKEDVAKAVDYSKQEMGARAANEKKKEEKASHGVVTGE